MRSGHAHTLAPPGARLPAAVFALILGVGGAAFAADVPEPFVALNYDVAPTLGDCPTEPAFRSAVVKQLGFEPFSPEARLVVQARVWPGEGGLEGILSWSGLADARLGERRFAARKTSCSSLIPAMVFALSVQIQMMVDEPAPDDPPAPEVEVVEPAPPSKPPPAPPPALPGDAPPSPWKVYGGVGGAFGSRVAPEATALGRLLFAVHNGRWLFELGAEASRENGGQLATRERFRHRLLLGNVGICTLRGALQVCGVGKLGALQVRGEQVDEPKSPMGFLAQVGPRLGWSWLVGDHFGLLARIDGLFLLTPWTVELNQVPAWTMPSFGATAGIDLFFRVE